MRAAHENGLPITPLLTVDCVLFYEKSVILISRGFEPHRGWYALPGGFVDIGETIEEACVREVREEIGLNIQHTSLKLIGVYSDPTRDLRRHTVSAAFLAEYNGEELNAGDDAESVQIVECWQTEKLAFDHKQIIRDAWQLKIQSSGK